MEEAKRARSIKFKAVHPDFATDETERKQRHYEIQLAYAHWEVILRLMDR